MSRRQAMTFGSSAVMRASICAVSTFAVWAADCARAAAGIAAVITTTALYAANVFILMSQSPVGALKWRSSLLFDAHETDRSAAGHRPLLCSERHERQRIRAHCPAVCDEGSVRHEGRRLGDCRARHQLRTRQGIGA